MVVVGVGGGGEQGVVAEVHFPEARGGLLVWRVWWGLRVREALGLVWYGKVMNESMHGCMNG